VYHGPLENAKEGFVNDWFQIIGDDFAQLLSKYPLPLNEAFSIGKNDFFRKYAIKISNEIKTDAVGRKELVTAYITEMIIKVYRIYKSVNLQSESIEAIVKIRNKIALNPERDWRLKSMAESSGYSVSRFCELYKDTYNISPVNDVIYERIEMAKRLLISGQASVASVSEACGFSTVNYFSKCFKKIVGCTPNQYCK
jgi:AraC-like DNA-binding protein